MDAKPSDLLPRVLAGDMTVDDALDMLHASRQMDFLRALMRATWAHRKEKRFFRVRYR